MRISKCKRERLIYIIVFLWIVLGILGIFYSSNLSELAVYFVSLTGFASAYIWGESARRSNTPTKTIFAPKSKREKMILITIILWAATGIFAIIKSYPLLELSAYFAALTPFVGAFILGDTYKKTDIKKVDNINNGTNTDEIVED